MTEEIACSGPTTGDGLQNIVAACKFEQQALFLAEQFPNHIVNRRERQDTLVFTTLAASPACSAYTSGRVFQDDRELRWERQGNSLHVVYVGPDEHRTALEAKGLKKSPVFDSLKRKTEPAYYYLFGERLRPDDLEKLGDVAQPGDFAVVRIPRILRYPVAQNDDRYARLVVCEYEDAAGRLALFRFQRLESVEK